MQLILIPYTRSNGVLNCFTLKKIQHKIATFAEHQITLRYNTRNDASPLISRTINQSSTPASSLLRFLLE